MPDLLLMKSLPEIIQRIYQKTKGIPYMGIYAFHSPVLFVRDLDLAGTMLINDFNHFDDRGFHTNEGDPLSRNLIHQSGQEWRFFRSKISASLSSNGVKSMFPIMTDKSILLLKILEKDQYSKGVVDVYDTSLRFTIDVLASSALGLEANSLKNVESYFNKIGQYLLGPKFIFHVFTGCFSPSFHRMLGITVSRNKVTKFFELIVEQITKDRKDSSDRKDVVQKLLQTKEECLSSGPNTLVTVNNDAIVGQVFGLFLAGFESTGNILASALYELAKAQDIQHTLHSEIVTVLSNHNNEVTMEALQQMKYLHQVLQESLRMYAPLPLIFRRCTKDYTIPNTSTVVEKGTMVLIPVRSILGDPNYYPKPTVFDPERFSEDNCRARSSTAAMFMPFGMGPRICPAVMYSYIEIKTALVYILRQFEVHTCKQTPDQYQPNPLKFLMAPKNGLPLMFKKRTI